MGVILQGFGRKLFRIDTSLSAFLHCFIDKQLIYACDGPEGGEFVLYHWTVVRFMVCTPGGLY